MILEPRSPRRGCPCGQILVVSFRSEREQGSSLPGIPLKRVPSGRSKDSTLQTYSLPKADLLTPSSGVRIPTYAWGGINIQSTVGGELRKQLTCVGRVKESSSSLSSSRPGPGRGDAGPAEVGRACRAGEPGRTGLWSMAIRYNDGGHCRRQPCRCPRFLGTGLRTHALSPHASFHRRGHRLRVRWQTQLERRRARI